MIVWHLLCFPFHSSLHNHLWIYGLSVVSELSMVVGVRLQLETWNKKNLGFGGPKVWVKLICGSPCFWSQDFVFSYPQEWRIRVWRMTVFSVCPKQRSFLGCFWPSSSLLSLFPFGSVIFQFVRLSKHSKPIVSQFHLTHMESCT
jgi:hypothetical protein